MAKIDNGRSGKGACARRCCLMHMGTMHTGRYAGLAVLLSVIAEA